MPISISRQCITKHLPIGPWKLELKMSALIQFNLFHFLSIHYKVKDHMDIEIVTIQAIYAKLRVSIIKLAFKQLILVCHINNRL
jgi:hypothetical protein